VAELIYTLLVRLIHTFILWV